VKEEMREREEQKTSERRDQRMRRRAKVEMIEQVVTGE
jgi:hypothetical protein